MQIIECANQEEARERAYWLVLAQLLKEQRRHAGRKGRLVLILMTNRKRMERRGQSRRRRMRRPIPPPILVHRLVNGLRKDTMLLINSGYCKVECKLHKTHLRIWMLILQRRKQ